MKNINEFDPYKDPEFVRRMNEWLCFDLVRETKLSRARWRLRHIPGVRERNAEQYKKWVEKNPHKRKKTQKEWYAKHQKRLLAKAKGKNFTKTKANSNTGG